MKFRTPITVPQYPFKITTQDKLFFLGSCFAEHIASYFADRRFEVTDNPFGILFNPLSIANALDLVTGKQQISDDFFQFYDEKWISFLHHGKFSHRDKTIFLQNIDLELHKAQKDIQIADYLFITFGTAYYYYHKDKNMVVANCHKLPACVFDKKRAEIAQIVNAFSAFFAWKKQHNPTMKVIFTVSPVRHLSDGFHENQLGKAILHLAVDEFVGKCDGYYFPSYEIFNDDLRDYRFYDKDLCHPAQLGIEYVQEILMQSFFEESTIQQIKLIEKENKRLQHRPLYVDE